MNKEMNNYIIERLKYLMDEYQYQHTYEDWFYDELKNLYEKVKNESYSDS